MPAQKGCARKKENSKRRHRQPDENGLMRGSHRSALPAGLVPVEKVRRRCEANKGGTQRTKKALEHSAMDKGLARLNKKQPQKESKPERAEGGQEQSSHLVVKRHNLGQAYKKKKLGRSGCPP